LRATISYKNNGGEWTVVNNSNRTKDSDLVANEVVLSLGDTNYSQIKLAVKNLTGENLKASMYLKGLRVPKKIVKYISFAVTSPTTQVYKVTNFEYDSATDEYTSGVLPLYENYSIKSLNTVNILMYIAVSNEMTGTTIEILSDLDDNKIVYTHDDEDYYFCVTDYSVDLGMIRNAYMINKDGEFVDSNYLPTENPNYYVDYTTITGEDYTDKKRLITPFGLINYSITLDGFVVLKV